MLGQWHNLARVIAVPRSLGRIFAQLPTPSPRDAAGLALTPLSEFFMNRFLDNPHSPCGWLTPQMRHNTSDPMNRVVIRVKAHLRYQGGGRFPAMPYPLHRNSSGLCVLNTHAFKSTNEKRATVMEARLRFKL
jgi:hypothetical protein